MIEAIEPQVRQLLATETDAVALSDKLFGPNGLFAQIGKTEAERRSVVRTALFQQAQDRLTELQFAEAEQFERTVEKLREVLPQDDLPRKVERSSAQ